MPSDAPIKPEPADLDRLMVLIALSGINSVEAVVATEIMLHALRGEWSPAWKDVATKHHIDPSQLSRAKSNLGLRITGTPDGLRVDLNRDCWFNSSPRSVAAKDLAQSILDRVTPPSDPKQPQAKSISDEVLSHLGEINDLAFTLLRKTIAVRFAAAVSSDQEKNDVG